MTIAVLYAVLILVKALLVLRQPRLPASGEATTIVQPILSGDPLLESMLVRNLDAHPDTQFLWMIDEDDQEAVRIAGKLARPELRVVRCGSPRDGENPKLAKLIRALDLVDTVRLTVLDDDTVLTGALPSGALVTGLPVFTAKSTIYERLIGGFVNGNALLTYLPAAGMGLQRTINGMIYSVDTAQLRGLGGFATAGHELTDDYAVARMYLRNGLSITQSTTPALVAMTVTSAAHYLRVMRLWMIFAVRYFGDNAVSALWIGLPGLLPFIGLFMAPVLWIALLIAKACVNRMLLWRVAGVSSSGVDVMFESVAEVLAPILMLLAFVRPNQLTWRTRKIELRDGAIRYK